VGEGEPWTLAGAGINVKVFADRVVEKGWPS
jgi:hypothetical protein